MEMTTAQAFTEASDGLSLVMNFDEAQSLTDLTALINSVCDRAESGPQDTLLVLPLGALAPDGHGWPGEADIRAVNRWERAVRRIETLDRTSIAVAHGTCGGAALDLLLAADFRVGAPGLRMRPPVNGGHIWPGMALYRLVRLTGPAAARRIVMHGGDITLEQAVLLGLVDHTLDDAQDVTGASTSFVERMADKETAIRRQLLREATTVEFDEALGAHLAACDRELRRLRGGRPGTSAPERRAGA
ncbi:enoyl-CoA hydratase/isomerase [Streptomyces sp. W007]|nr:enoyl-CoA hydratase/isomerase [Streptomyces sp. W007]